MADQRMNPGSPSAVTNGCTCPVEHNNHGQWPTPAGHWWVGFDCPLHRHLLPKEGA